MSANNKSSFAYIYILLMAIGLIPRVGDKLFGNNIKYIFALIISFISLFYFFKKNKEKNKSCKQILKFMFFTYFMPVALIHIYSIIMTAIGKFDKNYLSTNISAYIPVIFAMSSINLFEEHGFKYFLISVVLSWIFTLGINLLLKGVGIIPYAIKQAFLGSTQPVLGVSRNYLELHDIVLSLGMVIIYFIFFEGIKNKKNLTIVLIVFIIMLLGMKRIAVLGVIICCLFLEFIKKYKDKNKITICKWIGIIIFILCYLYVYIVRSDVFIKISNKYNINLMGRNYYYSALNDYYDLSVSFLGIGRNSVGKILTQNYGYMKVSGIHSDILKMFIENGFIVFGIWAYYYLLSITKRYHKRFNCQIAILYFSITIYTFILYLTDNVENYFIYQTLYILMLSSYALKLKKGNYNLNDKKDIEQ